MYFSNCTRYTDIQKAVSECCSTQHMQLLGLCAEFAFKAQLTPICGLKKKSLKNFLNFSLKRERNLNLVYILGAGKLSHKYEDWGRESLLASEHHVESSHQ